MVWSRRSDAARAHAPGWAAARLLAGLSIAALVAAGCGGEAADEPEPVESSPAESMADDMGDDMADDMDSPDISATSVPETLDFTARTVAGEDFDATALAGDPVVFWFWAAWCPKCAAAASDVAAVRADYDGRVHVVGVAGLGSGDGAMRDFVDRHQLGEFPHLADDEGAVWTQFGVTTQEYFVVLDSDGAVVQDGQLRPRELRDQLDSLVS